MRIGVEDAALEGWLPYEARCGARPRPVAAWADRLVELGPQRIAELANQTARMVLDEDGKPRRPLVDDAGQNIQVDRHELVDKRPAHFEHHRATIPKSGGMHLSNGGTSQRELRTIGVG